MVNAQDYYHSFIKMYDENVGEHCAICRQKDWLAIRCKYCSAPVPMIGCSFAMTTLNHSSTSALNTRTIMRRKCTFHQKMDRS